LTEQTTELTGKQRHAIRVLLSKCHKGYFGNVKIIIENGVPDRVLVEESIKTKEEA
jgi:type IV pilus biogenesis protein CpaD/CtpE